jgi:hypothetical protein
MLINDDVMAKWTASDLFVKTKTNKKTGVTTTTKTTQYNRQGSKLGNTLAVFTSPVVSFGKNKKYVPVASQTVAGLAKVSAIGSAAYGSTLLFGTGAAASTAAGTAASTTAASTTKKGLMWTLGKGSNAVKTITAGLIGAAGGYFAGSLSSGKNKSAQSATQTQTTSPTQSSVQNTTNTQYDYSQKNVNQKYTITDSPYASLYGSASIPSSFTPYTAQTPTQETFPSQSTEQASTQSASGSGWLIPALIIGGFLLLNKNK